MALQRSSSIQNDSEHDFDFYMHEDHDDREGVNVLTQESEKGGRKKRGPNWAWNFQGEFESKETCFEHIKFLPTLWEKGDDCIYGANHKLLETTFTCKTPKDPLDHRQWAMAHGTCAI